MKNSRQNPIQSKYQPADARGTLATDPRQPYKRPELVRHGKVTDMTLGGSQSVIELESDGSMGRFNTPKNP